MKPRAESQNIFLRLEIPEDFHSFRPMPEAWRKLFSNLVSNAINYSPEGER